MINIAFKVTALNLLKVTDMDFKTDAQTTTVEMDLANSIGFKIGGGIKF